MAKTAKEKGMEFTFTGEQYLKITPEELDRLDELMEKPDGGEAAREYYEGLRARSDDRDQRA